jgi:hypothetical protein
MKNNSIISKLQISRKLRQTFGDARKQWMSGISSM